jgi:ferric-dicitrate binding protein FerR (iron transport regulator)
MSARMVKAWCCFMLLLFPASTLLAETQAAMVMVSGIAALNGTAMAGTTTVFSGDLLETGANSQLTINTKGSTILIGANSRLHYFGKSIDLDSGSTQVNTSQKLEVQTETIKIEPNSTSAKFRVDRAPRTVVIAALEKEVRVDNNGESTVVPPGTTVTLVEQDQDQTASPVGGPRNRKIFAYFLIGTGATAGILYGRSEMNKKKVISNQVP